MEVAKGGYLPSQEGGGEIFYLSHQYWNEELFWYTLKQWNNIAQKDHFHSFIPATVTKISTQIPHALIEGER